MPDSQQVTSIQPRFETSATDRAFGFLMYLADKGDDLFPVGDPRRDTQLRELWTQEPILAGAVTSMVQKMLGLGWTVTGGKNRAARYSQMFHYAENGAGWSVYFAKMLQDFLTQDKGSFTELGRQSKNGPIAGIFNLDAGTMTLTGDPEFPASYQPKHRAKGNAIFVPKDDVIHIVSMPSPDERRLGGGFCAVSRAAKAAKLLRALYQYDSEKLSNLPPQGIASVTGLTVKQVEEATSMYERARQTKGQYIFPGILWLASTASAIGGGEVKVSLTPFSTLPESFDRQTVVNLYVYTLALDFGVDAREFWPATVTGATKADALVQSQKAKGKGPAEIMTYVEREYNMKILPEGVTFQFDYQDDEEDLQRAQIESAKIDNVAKLYVSVSPAEGSMISRDEARQLLANMSIIPEEMVGKTEEEATDIEGGKKSRSNNEYIWVAKHKGTRLTLVPRDFLTTQWHDDHMVAGLLTEAEKQDWNGEVDLGDEW